MDLADGGQHSSGASSFSPVGIEDIPMTGSAGWTAEDAPAGEPRGFQLTAAGRRQVQHSPGVRGWLWKPGSGGERLSGRLYVTPQPGAAGESLLERLGHFPAYFVAAGSDRRSDNGKAISGIGGISGLHGLEGLGDDPCQEASPTRVYGRQDPFCLVDDEHGQAVGHLDGQKQSGATGNDGIPLRRRVSRGQPVQANDAVGMALAQMRQDHGLSGQTGDKGILNRNGFDILSGLLETPIAGQRVVPGDAVSQAETVNQPGAGLQRRVLQA